MSLLEVVLRWVEAPITETPAYRCRDCGSTRVSEADSCSECGGETERLDAATNYDYWGPYY